MSLALEKHTPPTFNTDTSQASEHISFATEKLQEAELWITSITFFSTTTNVSKLVSVVEPASAWLTGMV